jgi:hypothetical protein
LDEFSNMLGNYAGEVDERARQRYAKGFLDNSNGYAKKMGLGRTIIGSANNQYGNR